MPTLLPATHSRTQNPGCNQTTKLGVLNCYRKALPFSKLRLSNPQFPASRSSPTTATFFSSWLQSANRGAGTRPCPGSEPPRDLTVWSLTQFPSCTRGNWKQGERKELPSSHNQEEAELRGFSVLSFYRGGNRLRAVKPLGEPIMLVWNGIDCALPGSQGKKGKRLIPCFTCPVPLQTHTWCRSRCQRGALPWRVGRLMGRTFLLTLPEDTSAMS